MIHALALGLLALGAAAETTSFEAAVAAIPAMALSAKVVPNPIETTLILPQGPYRSGMIKVEGTIRALEDGTAIHPGYAKAEMSVQSRAVGEVFRVPVKWDKPLPATVNKGELIRFSVYFPADRLLVRCLPQAACPPFAVYGPLPAGSASMAGLGVPAIMSGLLVEESEANRKRWSAPRVADKGELKIVNVPPYRAGQMYLEFNGISLETAEAIVASEGFRIVESKIGGGNPFVADKIVIMARFPPDMNIEAALIAMQRKSPFVQPVFYDPTVTP